MANSIADLRPEFWSKECQRSLFVENNAMAMANTQLRNILAGEGRKAHRTILSYPASATYTPGTDITEIPLTGSKETLEVDTFKSSLMSIDDTEEKQSIIDLGSKVAMRMMKDFNNQIEQAVTAQVTNAQHTLDDGNVGGTAGNNMSLNTDKIPQVFVAADTKLDAIDAPTAGRTAFVGTHFMRWLKLQLAGRDTVFGDGVNKSGVVANLFGWDIVKSNNMPYTAVLTISVQPTDGDTITIAGVVVTLHSTLPAANGVDIRTDVDTTAGFLRDLINYQNGTGGTVSGTVGTDFTDVSAEERFLWRRRGLKAVHSTSADTITLTGFGDITVSETFTSASNVWGSQRQDLLFAVRGCIDQVVQMPPKIEVSRAPKQFADLIKGLLGYGVKTFADGAREMVRVKVDASTSDWN